MKTRFPGISALVRCKDEGDSVYASLFSIKDLVDEVVFVDNESVDNSIAEAERFKNDHFKDKNFIIRPYAHSVAGGNHLADMNNFALSLTSTEWVMKWDVDTIAYTAGENSILKLKERVFANGSPVDIIRYSFFNLWGDYFHCLQARFGDPEYGPTGCGLELQGCEKRLYRYDDDIHFEMERYAEHFWEAMRVPLTYKEMQLSIVPGVHLQTVKPSSLVGRRFFLTRFTPGEREKYGSFTKFVQHELREANCPSLELFGKKLIIDEVNVRGTKFKQPHPDTMYQLGLMKELPYELIFDETNVCVDRKERNAAHDYLRDGE